MHRLGRLETRLGRHAAAQDPLHVLYLGNSTALGALRRLMEAHGAVTRSRLTPAVTVVIADPSVSGDHPTLRAAATLRIPVLDPGEAIVQFAGWRTRTEPTRQPVPLSARRSWPFRRRTR